MKLILGLMFSFLAGHANATVPAAVPGSPMKIGIVGLVHGHVESFLNGGSLTPAGGILNRPDARVVGIVEPDQKLFDSYAKRHHLSASLHFRSIQEMVLESHPRAVLVFTAPSEHRRVIEECAALGVHVMVEKPWPSVTKMRWAFRTRRTVARSMCSSTWKRPGTRAIPRRSIY